jgi:peptidoglycan/xylan/chitin deacetylase (PgdA/CDA1 family)
MKTVNIFPVFLGVFILSISPVTSHAQSYDSGRTDSINLFQWPEGKQMAISLTFDDARLTQADKGIPLLDKYGVKATFYVSPENMSYRVYNWRNAVCNGHDIGNHTLLHPCTGNFAWSRHKALEDYTIEKMGEEIDSASKFIEKIIGVTPVSFAFPCGQTFVGRGLETRSYVPVIAEKFETGRGWLDEGPNDPAFCDMAQLTGMELDGKSFDQIKVLIDAARSKGQWLILAGHEMDDSGSQTTLLSTVEALCRYASDPANGIWLDSVHNIAEYVKGKRTEQQSSDKP